jgi:hypothetical protein
MDDVRQKHPRPLSTYYCLLNWDEFSIGAAEKTGIMQRHNQSIATPNDNLADSRFRGFFRMKMYKISKAASVALLMGTSGALFAQDIDANAIAYADYEPDVDSMNASYQSYFAVKDPKGADDTVYNMSFSSGGDVYKNVDSMPNPITYTDTTAAQKIGYASNLCASQIAYNTLKAKGVALTSDQEAKYERVRDKFCLLVSRAAKLQQRIEKFNDIKDNGITLFQRYARATPSYDGHDRTIQMGMQLQFFPFISNICGSPDGDQTTTITTELDYCKSNMKSAASSSNVSGK